MGIEETLTQKFGPLAAWQWGILAGGGMFIARKYLSSVKTPGVTSVTLAPGSNGAAAAVSPDSTVGGQLNSLGAFLQNSGMDFGNFTFTGPDGTTVTWENGVPVFHAPPTPPIIPPPVPVTPTVPAITPPNPLPGIRPGGPIDPHTPNPLPGGRGGPVIPGVTPSPLPNGGGSNDAPNWTNLVNQLNRRAPTPPVTPPVTPPRTPPGRGGPVIPGTPPPLPFLGR